eukprot:s408_g13.t1
MLELRPVKTTGAEPGPPAWKSRERPRGDLVRPDFQVELEPLSDFEVLGRSTSAYQDAAIRHQPHFVIKERSSQP